MHVLLGLLTAVISVLYLLDRVGIDLGGMNPFYWRRRRAWAAKYNGDPIYSVEDPMHVAALLVAGTAKLDGDISAQQKQEILSQFATTFSIDTPAATQLLGSAVHLLGAPQIIDTQLDGVLKKNRDRFSNDQTQSILAMMTDVATIDGEMSEKQATFLAAARSSLNSVQPQTAWGS